MKRKLFILLCITICTFALGCGKNDGSKAESNKETDTNEPTILSDEECIWIELKAEEKSEALKKAEAYVVPEGVEYPYYIKVNRIENCTTVYGIDEKGEYSIPVKAFACSTGKPGEETIMGDFKTSDYYQWCYMVDGSYASYAIRFKNGYMFHAVPSYSAQCGDLEDSEFNKLGDFASLGCVRMRVGDVKWIYDNCKSGTGVTVYDEAGNPGPLGKPDTIKLPTEGDKRGWDPTDPDENNPWKNEGAKISGAKNIVVSCKSGNTKDKDDVDFLEGVTATDTCGNDITDKINVECRYTLDKPGSYDVKYSVVDAIGRSAEVTEKLVVE